ncbi:glycosyltransferase [Candidatus Pelagibacter sp.]|jgi:GT2 family glycosyltransferase|nr:glycosyltransferase [Candidatus Pelagibacter sp.]
MNKLYEEITITIVLYKENFEFISKCLNKVENFKIILVDNDGNLTLKEKIENQFKIFKYITNKKNLGFSKGINQAIKSCDTEYVLNLEADCIISENSILELFETFSKYENCIIATPTMIDNDNHLTHSGGALMEKDLGYKVLNLEGDVCVDFPMTAAILFKKQDMLNIGMFDEDLFIYYPDVEIGRRIKNFKKSIIQIYKARAIHDMGTLKINNPIKRVFFRNYFFTLDGLIYFYKANLHSKHLKKLEKKIPSLIIKSFLNIFFFKFAKSIQCFSQVLAYYKFKSKFLKKS